VLAASWVELYLGAARERRYHLPELARHTILLIGPSAARPDGLERLLVRGGFQVAEHDGPQPPDLLLYTPDAGVEDLSEQVRALATRPAYAGAPVFVVIPKDDAMAATEALLAGAQDVLRMPVHLPELRARLDTHIRTRAETREAREALRARDLLFDIFQEVSSALRAGEIFQTLVRRVGQAFGLSHCSFVLTAPGESKGRVVAVYENPAIRDLRVELDRYPEIQEAIRTERPVVIHDVHDHPLFAAIRKHWSQQEIAVNVQAAVALPVFVQGRAAGVFFLRTEKGDPQLRDEDVAFANTIAQAAARVLENEERRSAIYRRQISAGTTDEMTGCASLDALDRRIRDEFERARRYSLHFSLVLIDIDRLREINDRLGHAAGDRVLGEVGAILQREIRAPDFVARYGGDEFACVLPETNGPGARHFIQRLRQVFGRHTFADLGPAKAPAISAGVVAYPHSEALRPEDLFTLAEGALQKAKKDAPDRIAIAGEPDTT
jgi:two-component system, cell cycle response regulator